ncbi:MAG: hypothetical protein AB1403_22340, partial [Candidatus Riflebacteria bacterium]
VKALALAQAQGQRIYTITPSNAATALPKLPVGGEVGAEIRNAIQAGKEVTIHESPITAHGWTGYGYIIVDPETGAGAYLIEGKGNGGWFSLISIAAAALFLLLGIAANLAAAKLLAAVVLMPYYMMMFAALAVISYFFAQINGGFDYDCGGISSCDSIRYIIAIVSGASVIALLVSGSIVGVFIGILMVLSALKGGGFIGLLI